MQQPRVTVLMPVFNAEKFLKEAIESILLQSFTDFELLIIDDASTDNSSSIIREFTDERIRLEKNETNLGISATLNRGIALAKGEWIARMDADDISYPERLRKQFDYCQANPDCALLSCWVRVINEDGNEIRVEKYKSRFYYYNLCFECWMYHPSIMCRKDALEEIGGYTTPYSEDFELFWQLSRKYKVWNLPEVLMDYRITSTSLHQVLRKQEYEEFQSRQVQRNIQYYVRNKLEISTSELECLRHNFDRMLSECSIASIVEILKKLDVVTEGILNKQNPNLEKSAIIEAAAHKKHFIILYFARNLPKMKAISLLVRLKKYGLLWDLIRGYSLKKARV